MSISLYFVMACLSMNCRIVAGPYDRNMCDEAVRAYERAYPPNLRGNVYFECKPA